jgi:hypothetical protein
MARAKLFVGAAVGLCYFLVSVIFLGHQSTASGVIATREGMLRRSPCPDCVVIAGGSNLIYGIRSSVVEAGLELDTRTKRVVNISLWNEGYSFNNYLKWLSQLELKPGVLIYSSIGFYNLNKDTLNDDSGQRLDGEPLFSIFSSERLITKIVRNRALEFDDHGDLVNYDCNSAWLHPVEYKPFDRRAAERFIRHIRALGALYKDSPVLLRIPPAYISQERYLDWLDYFSALQQVFVQNKLADWVLNFAPQITVDKGKFCDTPFHVKKEVGELLSHELAHDIQSHGSHALFDVRP